MRWENVLRRFQEMFAEAVAANDERLSERFAWIVFAIRRAASQPPCALHDLLDYLDWGELAGLEVRDLVPQMPLPLEAIALDFEQMLAEHERFDHELDDDCEEGPAPYFPRPPRRSILSSVPEGLTPSALQISWNS
jgi:hypothetical protein